MSLSLIIPPPDLVFSADKINVTFLALEAIEPGEKAVNILKVGTNTGPGVNFIFYYGSEPLLMTSAAVPDNSGKQFLAGSGSPVPAADLLIYFRRNPRLNNDFDISAVGGEVVFTAKNMGTYFNCVPDTADVRNAVVGKQELKKDNYTVYFKLYLENDEHNGFDLIYRSNLQLLPGTSKATAPIGDKLHVAISKSIRESLIERPANEPIECLRSSRRYYFEYAESYGDPIEVHESSTSEIYNVIHGGMSTVGQFRTTCLELLAPAEPINDRFLRQGPLEFYTRVNQPQYLYFCNTRLTRTVDLVFDFFAFDSEESFNLVIGDINMEAYRKYAFNTRFDLVMPSLPEGVTIQYYQVYLREEGNRVSEIVSYYLDYTLNYYVRYFLNWSSLGALDSRATKGKGETSIQLTSKTGERIPKAGENIQYGHTFTYNSKIKRSFQVATGWLTRKELVGNADFFLSNLKYRYSNEMLLPIYTPDDKIKEIPDGSGLFSQIFNYEYHYSDHAYTDGDAEDQGMSIGIFGYNLGLTGTGMEIDPTVPSWVKAITQADIDRWNSNSRGEIIPAPSSAQTGGFFTVPWNAEKKAKYGAYGRFIVETESQYEPVPIQIAKDGTGAPTAYIFNLSGFNALIHVI